MRSRNLLIVPVLAAVIAAGFSASARSYKRGVSENNFMLKEEMEVLTPGVCWFYNWGNTPNSGIADYVGDETMVFLPMCWNANYNADNIRNYCKAHPEVKYLMGFNEPNFVSQANMTPQAAAEAWPKVKALADELGLKLVGPAVNYSPDGPENDPYTWYANFVNLVGKDAFDFIAIHNYSGGAGGMKDMIDRFYELYGKQIWVTEFCSWGADNVTAEMQIASMIEQLEYLEKSEKVYRYSWFKAKGSTSSHPCYGLIVPKNGYGERELSEQGMVYVYMTDFDKTVYHSVDEIVPATEYISSQSLMLGSNKDSRNPGKLEITRFNSGAYADYQFDIPSDGEYTLTMRVSGEGEPTRFDPTIGISIVDENGEEQEVLVKSSSFELSGKDEEFAPVQFKLNLKAGQQIIRIKDASPYMPSGLHISCISFNDGLAGVSVLPVTEVEFDCKSVDGQLYFTSSEEITDCEVYSLNGALVFAGAVSNNAVRVSALNAGLYIVKAGTVSGKTVTAKVVVY